MKKLVRQPLTFRCDGDATGLDGVLELAGRLHVCDI